VKRFGVGAPGAKKFVHPRRHDPALLRGPSLSLSDNT
jgi:hypothetical protein